MGDIPDDWTDEDERAWRRDVVREIHRLQDEQDLRVDANTRKRWKSLLQRFEQGAIDKEQMKRELLRPHLH